jgi:hypothetical protein
MKNAMTKLTILAAALFAISANASQTCTTDGADPLECRSADGQFQVEISATRDYTGLNVATNSFCRYGYMKLNGVEINGSQTQSRPAKNGLDLATGVTAENGINVTNPLTKQKELAQTAIEFDLSDAGRALLNTAYPQNIMIYGSVIVYPGNVKTTGKLFLSTVSNSNSADKTIDLICQ